MKSVNSNKQFNELTKQDKPFVLDFYADWCGPCQSLLPTVEKLAEEFSDKVEILKVNVDEQRELAQMFKVRSIPALFFMKNNTIVDKLSGMTSEQTLRKKVEALSNKNISLV